MDTHNLLWKKSDVEWEIKKNLTNAICISGANISSMELLLKQNKRPSKRELREALKTQMEYLSRIEKSKDEILKLLNLL